MYTCLPLLSQAGNFSLAGCQPYLTIGVNGTQFGLKTFDFTGRRKCDESAAFQGSFTPKSSSISICRVNLG